MGDEKLRQKRGEGQKSMPEIHYARASCIIKEPTLFPAQENP
jgi:hypothetical protein